MDATKIRNAVIAALRKILGEKKDIKIDDQTNPILELGLNSDDGVLFACELSILLEFDIPDNVNPFIDDGRKRRRNVKEMVDFLSALVKREKVGIDLGA